MASSGRKLAKSLLARVLVLALSALTLGLTFAHVLELPQRLAYNAELWTALTRPNALYRYFGVIGGPVEILAVIGAVIVAVVIRRPLGARRLAIFSASLHAAALVTWLAVVAPANGEIDNWTAAGTPPDWESWRLRWEAGHATSFVLLLIGYCALAAALLAESDS